MTDHTVTISAEPTNGTAHRSIPHVFSASCTCRGLDAGRNAIKWVLLAVQDHYADEGMTAAVGNLVDGHLVRDQIATRLEELANLNPHKDAGWIAGMREAARTVEFEPGMLPIAREPVGRTLHGEGATTWATPGCGMRTIHFDEPFTVTEPGFYVVVVSADGTRAHLEPCAEPGAAQGVLLRERDAITHVSGSPDSGLPHRIGFGGEWGDLA